jgi:putative sulfotransferase
VERFIVGTGRCGSTLLSQMLAEHPGALSIFELFNGMDWSRRFAPEPISGEVYGDLIAADQPLLTAVLRRGYDVAEIIYPFETGRHRRGDPLPWILVGMLPRLADDPDALFEEVMARVKSHPRQPAVTHHRMLFAWLLERLDKTFWLERSGSSLDYLGELIRHFPHARFLHIHRAGPETALSMVHHHAYRLPISLIYGAPLDDGARLADLGPFDLHAAPTGRDPISRVLASRPPPALFGRYWCDQVLHGYRALRKLDADCYAEVRFEDLVERPREVLCEIASFLELPDGGDWVARAAALVRGVPGRRVPELARAEREALEAECRPGQVLLGRA